MKMKNKKYEQKLAKQEHYKRLKKQKRKEPSLKRPNPKLTEKPSILIVCEGEKTEPSYFGQFRINSAKLKVIGKGYNTVSLVNEALDLSQKEKYDQVWCVFDKDNFPDNDFNSAIEKAKKKGLCVAYSNQSFEYWLMLHFVDHQGAKMNRNDYIKVINKYLEEIKVSFRYNKNVSEEFFEILNGIDSKTGKKRVDLAIDRARKIYKDFEEMKTSPAKAESSTTVFLLVKELLKYEDYL